MEKKYFYVVMLFVGLCHGVSKASECTERGRFPNDETNDCRGYTMCLMGGLTNFTQYKLMCPIGSLYSHIEEQCTNATNYQCYPAYNCTGVGNFAIPGGNSCSSFIACVKGLGEIGTARLVECPQSTLFNSTAGVCVNSTEFTCVTPKTNLNHSTQDHKVDIPINNAININVKLSLILFGFWLILMS